MKSKKVMFSCPDWIHDLIKEKADKAGKGMSEYIIISACPEVELIEEKEIKTIKQMVKGKEYDKNYVTVKKEWIKK